MQGTRVSLDMTTLTIMRALPREVDPVVFNMLTEDPGDVNYSDVGGEHLRHARPASSAPRRRPHPLSDRATGYGARCVDGAAVAARASQASTSRSASCAR